MSHAKTLIYPTSTTPLPTYPPQHSKDRTTIISDFAMLLAGFLQSALAAARRRCQMGVARHSGWICTLLGREVEVEVEVEVPVKLDFVEGEDRVYH
jgi:hypothetical protein